MYKRIPSYTRKSPSLPENPHLYKKFPIPTRKSKYMIDTPNLYDISIFTRKYSSLLDSPHLYQIVHTYTTKFPYIIKSPLVYNILSICTIINHICTINSQYICQEIPIGIKMFLSVQESTPYTRKSSPVPENPHIHLNVPI